MHPGGATGGEDGCKDQGHPPATRHQGRDRDAPSPSPPPFPSPDLSSSEKKPEDDEKQQQEEEEEEEREQQPTADLPEGPLVEILSRVPYRSLCRFMCVSKPWLALRSHPKIRERWPHTLSGFFYLDSYGLHKQFHNLSGSGPPMVDPDLPFLGENSDAIAVQCCSSLLLFQCYTMTSEGDRCDYLVCNPATQQREVLPPIVLSHQDDAPSFSLESSVFLGFDMAAPSSFLVFVATSWHFNKSKEVAIYSSQTRRWTCVQSEWDDGTMLVGNPGCVFLNGTMHFTACGYGRCSSLVTVDAEGKVWRNIEIPGIMTDCDVFTPSIGHSQGRLYAWGLDHYDCQLYVWVLEDYDSGKWTLKHTVNFLEPFGRQYSKDELYDSYEMFAIHPQRNVIFLTDGKEMTVSYDMDNQKVHIICTSGEFLGGQPYTPCFAEWRSDGH